MPTRTRSRTHTNKIDSARRYWIRVVERAADSPRRNPSLAHVDVALTVNEPGPRLDTWWTKKRAKYPERCGALRYDLMDDTSFDDRQAAEGHVREVRNRLARLGFAVNGSTEIYRTYVIELDPSQKPDHLGWLYVGQTVKPVAERIEEHRNGRRFRHSSKVAKNFRRPRLDLADPREYYLREDALLAESRLRVRLESLGYVVEGGQERYQQVLDEDRKT